MLKQEVEKEEEEDWALCKVKGKPAGKKKEGLAVAHTTCFLSSFLPSNPSFLLRSANLAWMRGRGCIDT